MKPFDDVSCSLYTNDGGLNTPPAPLSSNVTIRPVGTSGFGLIKIGDVVDEMGI